MNANIIKKHIIHEMKYDFKGHERSHVHMFKSHVFLALWSEHFSNFNVFILCMQDYSI